MEFNGKIIPEKSFDPEFKVFFSYKNGDVEVEKGWADVIRQKPKSTIYYDNETEGLLKEEDKERLELEILNLVIDYLLSGGVLSSHRGKYILRTA